MSQRTRERLDGNHDAEREYVLRQMRSVLEDEPVIAHKHIVIKKQALEQRKIELGVENEPERRI